MGITSVGEKAEKQELTYKVGGKINWLENWQYLLNLNISIPFHQHKCVHMLTKESTVMLLVVLLIIAPKWRLLKCPPTAK